MELLTEYEWTFARIATLLFLFLAGFLRAFYANENIDTYHLLVTTILFMMWLIMSKVLTNFIVAEQREKQDSISWSRVLLYYVVIPLILLAVVMMTGFFNE